MFRTVHQILPSALLLFSVADNSKNVVI